MAPRRHGPPAPRRTTPPARRAGLTLLAATLIGGFTLPAVTALPASAAVPGTPPGTVVNEPPTNGHSLIAFPQRDFVSASAYPDGHTYTVDVVHPDGTVRTAGSGLKPLDDPRTPDFDGLVEVNHPGGYCWDTTTPDIRPGDKVRIIDDATGETDQTTVANVTAGRPVQTAPDTVVVHGTAAAADGSQIPVAELEQRMVANRQVFAASGARTLRAASTPVKGGGTLAYDAGTGNAWTATYSGLTPEDVTMALGAESRALWLGKAVAPAVESTIFENGAGIVAGPAAPCTAPLEKLPPPPGSDAVAPSTPTGVTATVANNNQVTLNWTAATDNVGVTDYGVFRDGVAIATVQNADASAPAPTTFVDKNVPPGTYTYTVDAGDAIGNRSALSAASNDAVTTAAPAPTPAVHEPPTLPVSIISFPSRDFVSPAGFLPTDTVDISVIRDGKVVSTANGQIPQDDEKTAGFDGLVEVNHPGGGCWEGITPEIRPGDVIRTVAYGPDGAVRTVDQTRTANVTATKVNIVTPASTATAKDGVVEVTGTAVGPDGKPLPLDQVEQRLVANRDAFDLSAKRTLRAPGNGTMTYDTANNPLGIKWTARYSGLSSDDVYRAAGGTSLSGRVFPGAESRILWLGANPLSGQELTIFEVGLADPPGPVAGFCSAPLETPDSAAPTAPSGLTATGAGPVTLNWTGSTDNAYVAGYRVYRDGVDVTNEVGNVGGAFATPGVSTSAFTPALTFTDSTAPATPHSYTVKAFDNASPLGLGATDVEKVSTGIGQPYGNFSAASAAATANVTNAPPAPGGGGAPPTVNDPPLAPHALIAFPQRDFISATGYTAGQAYTFAVIRKGTTIATSTPVTADATGLAEVNHPGGGCWNTVTPNLQPGDVIRISGGDLTVPEQTTVPGVTAERPIVTAVDNVTGGGTVEIHGTAVDAAGAPIPVDQLEQRLVANRDAFDLNGRRTVRAGAGLDGTLTYDAAGSTRWTVKYTFQTPNDLARAAGGTSTSGTVFAGAESRILWLGRTPGSGVEQTIFENGPGVTGGPAGGIAGCTSGPAETPAPGAALSPAPTFADTAVGRTSAPAQTVTLTNNGTAPLKVDRAYLAGLNPGDFTLTVPAGVNGGTVAPGANVTVSVAFKPTATGTRQANLSFADDAANTTDQSVALTAKTPVATGPTATAPVQSLAAGQVIKPASPQANSTIAVDLRWTGTGARSELQMATGDGPTALGAFADVAGFGAGSTNTATSATLDLKMGGTTGTGYQFRVRSCSGTTCSAWMPGPKFTLQPLDDQGMANAAFKGTWTSEALNGSYGGTVKWAAGSATATIVQTSFTVTGNAAWMSTLGPDRGQAQVQVDGGTPQVVDLYSPTVQPARVVWARDALPAGNHTVTVTVIGKKSTLNPGACNTGTKCARVDVDGAVIIK